MNIKLFKNKVVATVAMLTIILGVGAAVAMKAPEKKTLANPYWQYDGSGSVTSPSNYVELSGSPSCSGNANICAIQAAEDPNNPGEPQIDTGLSGRITAKNTSAGDVFLKN
jgi:hypothetical protein